MTDIEKAREMPSEKSMEKARELLADRIYFPALPASSVSRIATALDAAITETREEMAKLAENAEDDRGKADSRYDGGSGSLGYAEACRDIAAAIRATGKE